MLSRPDTTVHVRCQEGLYLIGLCPKFSSKAIPEKPLIFDCSGSTVGRLAEKRRRS